VGAPGDAGSSAGTAVTPGARYAVGPAETSSNRGTIADAWRRAAPLRGNRRSLGRDLAFQRLHVDLDRRDLGQPAFLGDLIPVVEVG